MEERKDHVHVSLGYGEIRKRYSIHHYTLTTSTAAILPPPHVLRGDIQQVARLFEHTIYTKFRISTIPEDMGT